MSTTFQCPRRSESGIGLSPRFARDNDYDESDDTCHYCGSLNPDTFMAKLESGEISLGATDKNYKEYVEGLPNPKVGQPRIVSKINFDPAKSNTKGDWIAVTAENIDTLPWNGWTKPTAGEECYVMLTPESPTLHSKFYFQHLSIDQRKRFVELLNEKRIKFDSGGGFYVLPFFCVREEKETAA